MDLGRLGCDSDGVLERADRLFLTAQTGQDDPETEGSRRGRRLGPQHFSEGRLGVAEAASPSQSPGLTNLILYGLKGRISAPRPGHGG
jgi:hypothetical protein